MILLTKPDGRLLALNTDFIEHAEEKTGTVVMLVDGTEWSVVESLPEIVALAREFQASLLAAIKRQEDDCRRPEATLHVLPARGASN